jgi:hypothetical protein
MAYTKFTLKVTFNINITSMSKNKLTWKLPPWKGGKGGRYYSTTARLIKHFFTFKKSSPPSPPSRGELTCLRAMAYTKFTLKVTFILINANIIKIILHGNFPPGLCPPTGGRGVRGEDRFEFEQELHEEGG